MVEEFTMPRFSGWESMKLSAILDNSKATDFVYGFIADFEMMQNNLA